MKLFNRSGLNIYASVYSGDLPPVRAKDKAVYTTTASGNIPREGASFDAPTGVYWVNMATSSQPPEKVPPGTTVGQTGGVGENASVVLQENFRIIVEV